MQYCLKVSPLLENNEKNNTMKVQLNCFILLVVLGYLVAAVNAQEVAFEEYNLDNGMHVILHQDNSAPVATISVMYHVGAKDEDQH